MQESFNEYKKALTIGKLGFWEWDITANKVYWSDEKFTLLGFEPQEFEVNLEVALSKMHPDDVPYVMQTLQEKMPVHNEFDYEYRGLHRSGQYLNMWAKVEVKRDKDGNATGVYGTNQDITERKKLEEEIKLINASLENQVAERTKDLQIKIQENELLLKEMHHRVKNNLQIISSILRLQKDYLDDEFAITSLEECISRIKSMALIHESLYSNNNLASIDLKNYFEKLMQYHLNGDDKIKDKLALIDYKLEIGKMLPLGMIINELISNSIKHAFANEIDPEISLTVKNGNSVLKVQYEDNGKGFNVFEPRDKPSFGMDLINTLLEDLESEPVFTNDQKGFCINFEIKV